MKTIRMLASAAVALSFALPIQAQETGKEPGDPIVSVNGEIITQGLYGTYFSARQQSRNQTKHEISQQEQVAALNELINYILLEQDADASKLSENPAVLAQLKVARSQLLANLAIQQYLETHPVSEETLQQRYEEKTRAGNQEFKTRHILLESEEDANKVIGELDFGAKFAELAKSRSKDPSAENGGELDWFSSGQMLPEIVAAVAQMEPGKYSKKPVKTDFGWHVLLLEQTREVPKPNYEELRSTLLQEARQTQLNDYIRELREKAQISFTGQQNAAKDAQ